MSGMGMAEIARPRRDNVRYAETAPTCYNSLCLLINARRTPAPSSSPPWSAASRRRRSASPSSAGWRRADGPFHRRHPALLRRAGAAAAVRRAVRRAGLLFSGVSGPDPHHRRVAGAAPAADDAARGLGAAMAGLMPALSPKIMRPCRRGGSAPFWVRPFRRRAPSTGRCRPDRGGAYALRAYRCLPGARSNGRTSAIGWPRRVAFPSALPVRTADGSEGAIVWPGAVARDPSKRRRVASRSLRERRVRGAGAAKPPLGR